MNVISLSLTLFEQMHTTLLFMFRLNTTVRNYVCLRVHVEIVQMVVFSSKQIVQLTAKKEKIEKKKRKEKERKKKKSAVASDPKPISATCHHVLRIYPIKTQEMVCAGDLNFQLRSGTVHILSSSRSLPSFF